MSAPRTEAKPAEGTEKKEGAAPAPAAGGGIKAFLPLILNIVLMPVIAWVMTTKFLAPSLRQAMGPAKAESSAEAGAASAKEEEPAKAEESGHGAKEEKGAKEEGGHSKAGSGSSVVMSKLIVNVAGTLGTRYIVATLSINGNPKLKDLYEKNEPKLRDAACSAMSTKSISEMEKPSFRNTLRAELVSLFNGIMGKGTVSEIYLTDFAIQ